MNGQRSDWKPQEVGVRQGCTLSPLLFIASLTVVMDEVEASLREAIPLAYTPVFSFHDIEYADDTVIVAKTARVANHIMKELQRRARSRGLELNKEKTHELSIN
eukprot:9665721-Alexandrium_andersonii.AAC.1